MQQMKKIWCNNNKKLLLQTKKSYCNIKITSNATTKKYELQHQKMPTATFKNIHCNIEK